MNPKKVATRLNFLWKKYQRIINEENPSWEKINEARAILFLTGNIFCEKIAVEAIEKRLKLLKTKISLIEFLSLIDRNSIKLKLLRKDCSFRKLESFYKIIKDYKNKNRGGKYYLEEEKFLKIYQKVNPDKKLKLGYRGSF